MIRHEINHVFVTREDELTRVLPNEDEAHARKARVAE